MICASIGEKDFGKCRELLSLYPFCEIRGDLCNLSSAQLEELLEENNNVIFTYRFIDSDKETALAQTLLAIKTGVKFVDLAVEVPSGFLSKVKKAIAEKAEKERPKLIISWHSSSTPSLEEMKARVADCLDKGADIVKIVPAAANTEEASRVLQLYFTDGIDRKRLVAFASGKEGSFTRIACTGLGSPFTYCNPGAPTAQGQISPEEMANAVSPKPVFKIGDLSSVRRKKTASVSIPCSKSIVQRALLAAAITNGQSVLRNFDACEDIKAAIAFVRKCGCVVKVTRDGSSARGEKMLIVRSAGISKWKSFQTADSGQSALLLRMLLPLCAYASSKRNRTAISSRITVTGGGSLSGRNLLSDIQSLKNAGVKCQGTNSIKGTTIPVTLSGASFRKAITISGKDTSQTVTGLLMVLPLLDHDTVLTVENASSIPYINLTIKVLSAFGIYLEYKREGRTLHFDIEGRQGYSPVDMFLESDWSGASNFLVLGSIAGKITVKKLHTDSSQADERILEVLSLCAVDIHTGKTDRSEFSQVSDYRYDTRRQYYQNLTDITVRADGLNAFCFDATDCPDLFPILTTLAVYCNGTSRIKGVHRLVNKESNRAESILLEFSRMGYCLHIEDDELIVEGNGGKALALSEKIHCSSHNDHRIAMAIIICSMARNYFNSKPSEIFLDDIECIGKSFPTFVERLQFNTQKT